MGDPPPSSLYGSHCSSGQLRDGRAGYLLARLGGAGPALPCLSSPGRHYLPLPTLDTPSLPSEPTDTSRLKAAAHQGSPSTLFPLGWLSPAQAALLGAPPTPSPSPPSSPFPSSQSRATRACLRTDINGTHGPLPQTCCSKILEPFLLRPASLPPRYSLPMESLPPPDTCPLRLALPLRYSSLTLASQTPVPSVWHPYLDTPGLCPRTLLPLASPPH